MKPKLLRTVALLPALLASACVTLGGADVPVPLRPPIGEALRATVGATGVQIYECRNGADGRAPAWTLLAPEAVLFDAAGKAIGTHGAGPHWLAADGSRLTGKVLARADDPTAGASIPWLLLAAEASGPAGAFSGITHIQRVNTRGGAAPAAGCGAATLGLRARIDYRADYRLFGAGVR
jgi:hypothetical protein